MKPNFLEAVKAYAAHLQSQTGTQAVIMPSLLKSEKFHVELNLLPHPVIVGNGRIRLRLRATVYAEIPASDPGINDCLKHTRDRLCTAWLITHPFGKMTIFFPTYRKLKSVHFRTTKAGSLNWKSIQTILFREKSF